MSKRSQTVAARNQKCASRKGPVGVYGLASRALLVVACGLLFSVQSIAQYGRPPESGLPKGGKPDVLQEVSIEQRLHEQVPLELKFRDQTGREVQLAEYFKAGKPVMLSLVYYECPMMCNEILNGQVGMMQTLKFTAGQDYQAVTVSFDPRETPQVAAAKRQTYLQRYGREGAGETGWHFLTGDEANIKRLTEAVGFHYRWDEASNQYAHASALMLLTPEGKLSHYFYGIEYSPKDVRLGLVQASAGQIGSPVDQLILYCYHYDPTTGRFSVVMSVMRIAGLLTLFGLVALVLILRRHGSPKRPDDDDDQMKWAESVKAGGTV